MKTTTDVLLICLALLAVLAAPVAAAAPPDYKVWGELLSKYYDPAKGMNYKALKANDKKTLDDLRRQMGTVEVQALSRLDQFAYWINLYNINVVGIVVDHYPVASIRDISTDPIIRLNVFKKDWVQAKKGAMSLNDVENDKIREGFKDPRIHFAINCASRSCPPIAPDPFRGAKLDGQFDRVTAAFLSSPRAVVASRSGTRVTVSKIFDWYEKDFGDIGGVVAFIRKYAPPAVAARGAVKLEFQDYDWTLNEAP